MYNMFQKVLLIGLGITGCAVAKFLIDKNISVVAVDSNIDKLKNKQEIQQLCERGLKLSDHDDNSIYDCDIIVKSPGVPCQHPICCEAALRNIDIIGEIESSFERVKIWFNILK